MTHNEPIHWDLSSFERNPNEVPPPKPGPDRRDWIIVIGGVVALVALGWLVSLFVPAP